MNSDQQSSNKNILKPGLNSLRSWRDFASECFVSGRMLFLGRQVAREVVRSRVEIPAAVMRGANFGLA